MSANTGQSLPLILVADDQRASRVLLRRLLTKAGYDFVETENGEECLQAYQEHQPDMVLLDALMPVMDGFTCCERLRELPESDRVPILMITGLDDKESVDRAFQAGATDYITKPIHPPVLIRRLHRLIEASHAEKELHRQYNILQGELQEAAKYVRSLLPSPLQTSQLTIEQKFVPSLQLGGDAFDYYWLDEHHLVLYLLDVSGHGVRPALLSVSVLNLLRSKSLKNADFYQPQTVLTELNRVFSKETEEDYFTIWYGVYNCQTKEILYACAGHPPALLFHSWGVEKLAKTGLPIGMFPETQYQQTIQEIPKNSQLYLFSDGVYEIPQKDGTWGIDDFIQVLLNQKQNQEKINLSHLYDYILNQANQAILLDDFSILKVIFSEE